MIISLKISNYALIDTLEIDFSRGLNIVTGETGAGKSIMLGALGLLLGARADSRAIRRSERKSVVEALFDVSGNELLARWAETNDVEWDPAEMILRREIATGGRSRAFINDSPVNLSTLAEAGALLVDIHSQHQNRLLESVDYQLGVIDSMAANGAELAAYKAAWNDYRAAGRELQRVTAQMEATRADEEYMRYRLKLLDDADLQAGELEELEAERDVQSNMSNIKESLRYALSALTEGDDNVLSLLNGAADSVAELNDVIDGMQSLSERLESARIEIQDVAETLADYDSNLNADPRGLEQIEERLSTLYMTLRSFKVDTVDQLIAIREELHESLSRLDDSDFALGELQKRVEQTHAAAVKAAKVLTATRQTAAKSFGEELLAKARPLGMANLRVFIQVTPAPLSASGADKVEFLFSFNKNQKPAPVAGQASGGEVSRLMLCLKAIVAGRVGVPTIIFDEVDTGVSGDVAIRMGEMMQQMGNDIQVITITHLPQVAALGACHFKVYKEDDSEATHTRIRRLDGEGRRAELALMLSGSTTDPAALAAADSLLKNG